MSENKGFDEDLLMEGHDYDGIQELDNKLPPWWLIMFFITIIWGAVYVFYYDWSGWGPTQRDEYIAEVREHKAKQRMALAAANTEEKTETVKEVSQDVIEGKKLFNTPAQLCFTCHGADGGGLVGPNLTDEYWLHGGSYEDIKKSIKTGFPTKGMLPYGSGAKLTDKQLDQLASFIVSLRGTKPASPKAPDLSRAKKYTGE